MKKQLLGIIVGTCLSAPSVFAADCGEPPLDMPAIPDGSAVQAAAIRSARNAVVEYSTKVDEYLACMDQRASRLMPYMTKEQQTRWDEDLANLHEGRRELQNQMNLAIRAFRRSNQNNS